MAAFSSNAFSTSGFSVNAFDFGATPTPDTGPPLGGKGDNERARKGRGIVKPTGLLDRPQAKKPSIVEERLRQAEEEAAQIAERLAREFSQDNAIIARNREIEVARLTQAQIDQEIGALIRKKIRNDEEELLLLLLIAASAA